MYFLWFFLIFKWQCIFFGLSNTSKPFSTLFIFSVWTSYVSRCYYVDKLLKSALILFVRLTKRLFGGLSCFFSIWLSRNISSRNWTYFSHFNDSGQEWVKLSNRFYLSFWPSLTLQGRCIVSNTFIDLDKREDIKFVTPQI